MTFYLYDPKGTIIFVNLLILGDSLLNIIPDVKMWRELKWLRTWTIADWSESSNNCGFTQSRMGIEYRRFGTTCRCRNVGEELPFYAVYIHNRQGNPEITQSDKSLPSTKAERSMRTALFWVITQRIVVISYRRFGSFYLLRLIDSPLCRACRVKEETSAHILCECEALVSLRHTHLVSLFSGTRGY